MLAASGRHVSVPRNKTKRKTVDNSKNGGDAVWLM